MLKQKGEIGLKMKTALTIAGSDCSGGAGIQADIKTMTMNGVYAMSVITALTAQNTTGVAGISEVTTDFLKQQIDAAVACASFSLHVFPEKFHYDIHRILEVLFRVSLNLICRIGKQRFQNRHKPFRLASLESTGKFACRGVSFCRIYRHII